jgi:hypothetical protein
MKTKQEMNFSIRYISNGFIFIDMTDVIMIYFQSLCQVLGGHLVEIEDATENSYLVSQAKLYSSK